jgi:hypothetical protein
MLMMKARIKGSERDMLTKKRVRQNILIFENFNPLETIFKISIT